jgi:phosphoglycolate phosphatase-like HAD superfamily hydrolase
MMPIIYMDLDGTILDVWPRYYSLMKLFFEQKLLLPFPTLQEYQHLKLNLIQDAKLIQHFSQGCIASKSEVVREYMLYKQRMLENEQMLWMDTVFGQLHLFVAQLKPEYKLHLLSVRRNRSLGMRQLHHLNIRGLFDRIDFVSPLRESNPKWDLIKDKASKHDVIIGDSETDIICGSMLEMRTYHVSTGLRSYEYATRYGPAIRLSNYSEILDHL